MAKFIGFIIFMVGLYFLSQDIIVTTRSCYYWYRCIPANLSILAIMGGVLSLLFLRGTAGNLGWILLGMGAVLVFLSGGVILRGTPLWNFIVAFGAMAIGYQLITVGRVRL